MKLNHEVPELEQQLAMAHARNAATWIATNRPDVGLGVEPDLLLVAQDDEYSLPELEDFGRAGNAVKLCDGPFGTLWWCDPEGRDVARHQCLLHAAKPLAASAPRTVLLRFHKSV